MTPHSVRSALSVAAMLISGCVPLQNATVSHSGTIEARQNWEACADQTIAEAVRSGVRAPTQEVLISARRRCAQVEAAFVKTAHYDYYRGEVARVVEEQQKRFDRLFVSRLLRARMLKTERTWGRGETLAEWDRCARAYVVSLALGNPEDPLLDLVSEALGMCYDHYPPRELLPIGRPSSNAIEAAQALVDAHRRLMVSELQQLASDVREGKRNGR